MPLTMQTLAGFGALAGNPAQDVPVRAKPQIDAYVECVRRQGLQRAFYLQDPRQENVTEAHRRNDPCYPNLTDAVYMSMKVVGKYHLGLDLSDADVARVFQASREGKGVTFGKTSLSPESVNDFIREARGHVEFPAEAAVSKRVGRVVAQDVESPLKIGVEEWQRRVSEQEKKVQSGELVRGPIKASEVISPEEQERRRRETRRAAEEAARKRGPLVSCPRGVPYEVCLRERQVRQPQTNVAMIVGVALAGLLAASVAWRLVREERR